MSFIYHTFFFDPLYNALIILFHLLPWADAGIIVILLTVLVRLVLYPLSKKAVVTQMKMSEIAPEIEEIKRKFKDKPDEQARQTLSLYRTKKINPFAGIAMIVIQIPLIFALYRIFLHFSEINTALLYSFVPTTTAINQVFLGLIDLGSKSVPLALLAAASTFFQLYLSPTNAKPAKKDQSVTESLTSNIQTQMKYVFPVMVFFISYTIPAVISLYWITTNSFTIAQEVVIKKKHTPQTRLS